MTYNLDLNFNNAPLQSEVDVIPAGTVAKAIFRIRGGGIDEDGWLTKSGNTGALYINAEITIVEGPYARRKFFSLFGVKAGDEGSEGSELWAKRGRALIRALIESARNIHPKDASPAALEARSIQSWGDLQELTCAIKIGIDEDKNGVYPCRNKVMAFITPDHKDYQALMGRVPATVGGQSHAALAPALYHRDAY